MALILLLLISWLVLHLMFSVLYDNVMNMMLLYHNMIIHQMVLYKNRIINPACNIALSTSGSTWQQ